MATFRDLVVRVGADISGFRDAFKDATEALEAAGDRATRAGGAINRAFEQLGVSDASAKVATEAKRLQSSFELLEKAYKDGKITAEDFAKAQAGVRTQMENLGKAVPPVVDHAKRIGEALKGIGVDKTKFQIDQEVTRLKSNLDVLEEEYKQGRVSAEDYAKAQKHVADEITKLTKVPVESFADKLKKLDSAGRQMKDVGQVLTGAFTLPLAGAGLAITKFSADFDSAMRQVTSLLGGVSDAEFKKLSTATLEMSQRMGVDGVQSAKALYEAISAGVPKENALTFIEVASKAAIAGVTDTKVAVDGMTNIMNAFGLETGRAQEVADAMFQAVNVGKFTFEQLAGSVGIASGTAAQMSVEFKELLASAASLTKQGFTVSEAFTNLQSVMTALIKPNKEMVTLLQQTGFQSGEALLKAKGLQGAIQALDAAAQHNSGTLAEAYGRTEALKASLGLVGQNAKTAATDLSSISNSAGAATKALDEIEKSTTRMAQKAFAEFKNLAIELGGSLLPAVNALLEASRPLVGVIQDVVKWFVALPEPVRNTAAALAVGAAAVGPLVFALGTMIESISTIAGLFKTGGLLAYLGSGAGLAGLLSVATPLAIAFGVAIAGWAIYKAVTEIGRLNAELDRMYDLQQRGVKATQSQANEIRILESAIAAHNKQVGVQKITVDATGKSIEQYIAELRNAVKGLDEFKGAGEKSNAVTKDGKINLLAAAEGYLRVGDSAKKAADGVNANTGSQKQNEEALKKSAEAAYRVRDANDAMHERYEKFARDYVASAQKLNEANRQFEKSLTDLSATFAKAHEDMRKKALEPVEITVKLSDRVPQVVQDAVRAQKELDDAFKRTGGTTIAELDRMAKQAEKDYELIKASGVASPEAILKAEVAYIRASIEARRAHGETITKEEEDRLRKLEEQLSKSTQKQAKTWEGMMRQVSTIMTDLSKDISEAIIGIFKGNPENDRLRAEAEDLRASLEQRASDWESYQQDVAVRLEEIRQKHADELARQEADLNASLSAEQAEYEEYVANVNAQIEQVRADHAKKLEEETAELHLELGRREGEYQEFQREIERRRVELREQHAKQLAEELADLRANLAEKQEAYDDFVADSKRSLARLQEDFVDDTGDEKRSLDRKSADKSKSLKREEEDTERKIARELKKGKNANQEQIDDWRRTLERKREDTEESIRREEEDYADFVEERRRRLNQQVEDNKLALERRTRDHEQYLASVTAKESEIRQKHADRLAQEEGDLDRSLANRTRDLEQYRVDVQGKVDAITRHHFEKMNDEILDLNAGLATKTNAWDAYKVATMAKLDDIRNAAKIKLEADESNLAADFASAEREWNTYRDNVKAKLQEIQDKISGPTDSIKKAFEDMFEAAGQAIIRFGVEYLEGKLFKWLRDNLLDDILAKVGRSLGSVFDKIVGIFTHNPSSSGSGGGGGIPGVPGGGSDDLGGGTKPGGLGGGGATALGAMVGGPVGAAIGAAVDLGVAVMTMVGGMRREGTLNAIEENTRFAMLYNLAELGHALIYWPKLEAINSFLWDTFQPALASLMTTVEGIHDMIRGTLPSVLGKASQMTVDEDGKPVPVQVAVAGTGDESLGALIDRFGNDILGTTQAISAQIGQLLDPWTMRIHDTIRDFTKLPWRPALDKLTSARPVTITLEMNSREFARAIVGDINAEQAFRLKLAGQAVY